MTRFPAPVPDSPRILLVRLRQIGDVVFTTPAVAALRKRFPSARLTYLVEPAARPVIAGNPHLDEVIVAPNGRGLRGFLSDLALGRRLRRSRFDITIDFHGGPRASMLTWLSGASVRLGYTIVGRSWMYTTAISRPRALRARHSVVNQWDLLEPLGVPPLDPETDPIEIPTDPGLAEQVAAKLMRAGVTDADRLIVMHVSAGNPFRRWPIESFATVAATLLKADPHRRVIVTAGPSDADARERVIAATQASLGMADRDRVLACGEFSLGELRALTDRASLYIGGDSGPLHIASASHVPIVALYGPTLPARSAPWRARRWRSEAVEVEGLPCRPCDQRVCLPGDFRCLTQIRAEEVVRAAGRAMDAPDSPSATPSGTM